MMIKMTLIIILIFMFLPARCPEFRTLPIERMEPISRYGKLIKAIVKVESQSGKYLYNLKEQAVGAFQIRQIRVDDYNKRLGTKYVLKDFYGYNLSRKMFLYYADGKDYETASKNWNGSGRMTIEYWKKVKKYL